LGPCSGSSDNPIIPVQQDDRLSDAALSTHCPAERDVVEDKAEKLHLHSLLFRCVAANVYIEAVASRLERMVQICRSLKPQKGAVVRKNGEDKQQLPQRHTTAPIMYITKRKP